jgi:hypothetical protein
MARKGAHLGLRSGMVHQMHGGRTEFTGPDTASERFFFQALHRYKDSDYPYPLELRQAGFIG